MRTKPLLLRYRQVADEHGAVTVALTILTRDDGVLRHKLTYKTVRDVPPLEELIEICAKSGKPPH